MNDHAQRRNASLQETLTAIDDAVQRRCSQCHSPLPEDSPSEWFCPPSADADCQWSWHQAQAVSPGEVYVGVDAGYQIDMEQLHGHTPSWVASPNARVSVLSGSGWQDITEDVSDVSISPDQEADDWPMRFGIGGREYPARPDLVTYRERIPHYTAAHAIGEFVGVPVSESSDLPEGIALRYTTERGIEVPPAQIFEWSTGRGAEVDQAWVDEAQSPESRQPSLTVHNETHRWIPDEDWRRTTSSATDNGGAPAAEFHPWEPSFWHRMIRRLTNSGGT